MNHKIQVSVDSHLNSRIRTQAATLGLSVSAFARLAILQAMKQKKGLLAEALEDFENDNTETLTLDAFNRQVDDLLK